MLKRLLHFDSDPHALIEPSDFIAPVPDFLQVGVTTFSSVIIDAWAAKEGVRQIAQFTTAGGPVPIYGLDYRGVPVALYRSLIGSPAASGQLEEALAMGLQKLVAFGSCGVLDGHLAPGQLIVPTAAMRDEGTSYHYLPPSEEVCLPDKERRLLLEVVREQGFEPVLGKTWTTDAIYRETDAKVAARKTQGCIAVEMECAALAAVAQFRGAGFTQFLYAADSLDGDSWDARDLAEYGRASAESYMAVALETARRM